MKWFSRTVNTTVHFIESTKLLLMFESNTEKSDQWNERHKSLSNKNRGKNLLLSIEKNYLIEIYFHLIHKKYG